MSGGFRACRVFDEAGRVAPRLVEMVTEDLSPGDVVVRVHWSGLNYKDALAVTGRGKVLKQFPLCDASHGRPGSSHPWARTSREMHRFPLLWARLGSRRSSAATPGPWLAGSTID